MKASGMIESIRGTVEAADDSSAHVRTGPVVLAVLLPGYFLRRISPGQTLDIPVYLHLQLEGNRLVPILVGFPDRRDREFFSRFISVSGVGVRAAVKALARPPSEIAAAIAGGDHAYLTTLPGIGAKRAKEIVAKLQEQMEKEYGPSAAGLGDAGSPGEARAVLRQLGIPAAEADGLVARAVKDLEDNAESSEIVKQAMRIRSRR
jgi:holliday junction DNA helicase RuvA